MNSELYDRQGRLRGQPLGSEGSRGYRRGPGTPAGAFADRPAEEDVLAAAGNAVGHRPDGHEVVAGCCQPVVVAQGVASAQKAAGRRLLHVEGAVCQAYLVPAGEVGSRRMT